MKNRIEYLEGQFEMYKEMMCNCHPTMEEFYYKKAKDYELLVADVKNGDQQ